MATPSRSGAVSASTPKNNMAGTPTRVMASPRPGLTGAAARPLGGKSPAVKTPASGHGHSHHLSSSSHPFSTPMAAPTMPDDFMALNSPAAALMASLNGPGLTSTPGQDGLGISTLRQGGAGLDAANARNIEAERLRRLQEVAEALKVKVAGPGITREGVERLAQLNSFALLPDQDNITVAGNHCVDLEITFDHLNRDRVKNVVLKINMSGEDEHKKTASDILRDDLTQSSSGADGAPWKTLDSFASNLGYLGQLDHLSSRVNCFAAIAGLHTSFQKIWEEEKKRLTWRKGLHQVSRGAIGRPSMDRNGKLGLCIDYLADKQELRDTILPGVEEGSMMAEEANSTGLDSRSFWQARISCETGSPSITKFRDWLLPDIFTSNDVGEVPPGEQGVAHGIAWRDPIALDNMTGTKEDQDAMMEDIETILEEPSNIRFVAHLDPPVLLPLNVILGLNSNSPIIEVDHSKVIKYHDHLMKIGRIRDPTNDGWAPQWSKRLCVFDKDGQMRERSHVYSVYSAQTWCYAVDKLVFNHPKLIAGALPTLRQYARLWSLLENLMPKGSTVTRALEHDAVSRPEKNVAIKMRSNRPSKTIAKPRRAELDVFSTKPRSLVPEEALPVNISLDVVSNPSVPTIDVFPPFEKDSGVGKISVGIRLNGELAVSSTVRRCLDGKTTDKMVRVLNLSEDLGVLAEWVLERVRVGPR